MGGPAVARRERDGDPRPALHERLPERSLRVLHAMPAAADPEQGMKEGPASAPRRRRRNHRRAPHARGPLRRTGDRGSVRREPARARSRRERAVPRAAAMSRAPTRTRPPARLSFAAWSAQSRSRGRIESQHSRTASSIVRPPRWARTGACSGPIATETTAWPPIRRTSTKLARSWPARRARASEARASSPDRTESGGSASSPSTLTVQRASLSGTVDPIARPAQGRLDGILTGVPSRLHLPLVRLRTGRFCPAGNPDQHGAIAFLTMGPGSPEESQEIRV